MCTSTARAPPATFPKTPSRLDLTVQGCIAASADVGAVRRSEQTDEPPRRLMFGWRLATVSHLHLSEVRAVRLTAESKHVLVWTRDRAERSKTCRVGRVGRSVQRLGADASHYIRDRHTQHLRCAIRPRPRAAYVPSDGRLGRSLFV